jgi:formylglycine-generating enzyme required for sulfatase activity
MIGNINRVIRGGSWYYEALGLRTAYRDGNKPGDKFKGVGFRIALSAQ